LDGGVTEKSRRKKMNDGLKVGRRADATDIVYDNIITFHG